MKSLDLQSFLQNSCIEPDEFVLNVDSDFFRLLPNLLQSHNTCSHFVCIPCNINLRFLRCIYQYILECLLRSRRKVVLTGCLYVHEKHYIHILTNPFRVDLVRNVILSVYHNKNYSNQKIMKDELERLLNQQWLHHKVLKEIEDEDK